MGFFSWLSGKESAPEPQDWAPELPDPPAGFSWHRFEEARVIVLRPDGWYVHQLANPDSFTGCISAECIQAVGAFETGLTVQVLRRVQEMMGGPPSAVAVAMYQGVASDQCNDILHADEMMQPGPHASAFRFRYRNAPAVAKPIIVHKFCIAFDRLSELYMFTFESPERQWEESWQTGNVIMSNLVVSSDVD
jgi:hypothetical protein